MILVESQTKERAPRRAPSPELSSPGARWGKAPRFAFEEKRPASASSFGAPVTDWPGFWPTEYRERDEIRYLAPVWRRIDVVRVPSSEDPNTTEDVSVTREVLIPLGQKRQKYIGGGSYVEDARGHPYEERVVHTFLLLELPPPLPDAEVVDTAVDGEWPAFPDEMFTPGTFIHVPLPGPWGR